MLFRQLAKTSVHCAAQSLVWMAGMAVGQHYLPTGSCRQDRVSIIMETRSCLKRSSFPEPLRDIELRRFVEQRERYFIHLRKTGARRSTLRKCANDQLSLVRLLNLKDGARVRPSQIEAATAIWSHPKARRCDRSASPNARHTFSTTRSDGCVSWAGSTKPNVRTIRITQRSQTLPGARPFHGDYTRLLPSRRPLLLLTGGKRHAAGCSSDGQHR